MSIPRPSYKGSVAWRSSAVGQVLTGHATRICKSPQIRRCAARWAFLLLLQANQLVVQQLGHSAAVPCVVIPARQQPESSQTKSSPSNGASPLSPGIAADSHRALRPLMSLYMMEFWTIYHNYNRVKQCLIVKSSNINTQNCQSLRVLSVMHLSHRK